MNAVNLDALREEKCSEGGERSSTSFAKEQMQQQIPHPRREPSEKSTHEASGRENEKEHRSAGEEDGSIQSQIRRQDTRQGVQ